MQIDIPTPCHGEWLEKSINCRPGTRGRVVQREDVRVLELGGDLDLAEEPFRAENSGQLGPQYLDRHLTVVFQILGEVDGSHAAGTHFFFNGVAVG